MYNVSRKCDYLVYLLRIKEEIAEKSLFPYECYCSSSNSTCGVNQLWILTKCNDLRVHTIKASPCYNINTFDLMVQFRYRAEWRKITFFIWGLNSKGARYKIWFSKVSVVSVDEVYCGFPVELYVLSVTRIWPIIVFPQILHSATYQLWGANQIACATSTFKDPNIAKYLSYL
jgi:hypothetical protein